MHLKRLALVLASSMFAPAVASAGPIGVDGIIGGDWAGVTFQHVSHDAGAPVSNFGSPTSTTVGPSYDVGVRDDGSYYYVALSSLADAPSAGAFANLYFDTDPQNNNGSDVGFEVTNNRYFIAGAPGYYPAAS